MTYPGVVMAEQAWRAVRAEMERVFPREGLAVPLMALEPRRPDGGPWDPMGLEDIASVVVPRVLLVPPEQQHNQAARVSVLPRTDALVFSGGDDTASVRVVVRPSGTEPKLKCYLEVRCADELAAARERAALVQSTLADDVRALL